MRVKMELLDSTELSIAKRREKSQMFLVAAVRLATLLIFLGIFSVTLSASLQLLNKFGVQEDDDEILREIRGFKLTENINQFVCPANKTIEPCICYFSPENVEPTIDCSGSHVTQETLTRLFDTLKTVNNLQELELHTLKIQRTKLTQLDLTPMKKAKINRLTIASNEGLRKVFGSMESRRSIEVRQLDLSSNNLDDLSLLTCLNLFSPKLTHLYLSHNKIRGTLDKMPLNIRRSPEFVPGLWSFPQLRVVDLTRNSIQKVTTGQFQGNKNLMRLFLAGNQITNFSVNFDLFHREVKDEEGPGQAADYFDQDLDSDLDFRNSFLQIVLDGNLLNNDGFACTVTGLKNSVWSAEDIASINKDKRPIALSLIHNDFDYLTQSQFETFFSAHGENTVAIGPLKCDDPRLQWLRIDAENYRNRVFSSHCKDHPHEFLFDSKR